jgi:quercetin dioxygenase-like cupin family protein
MAGTEPIPDFIRTLPEIELPLAGARGWLLQGATQQAVFVEFDETVEVPEHHHAEQWEICLAGRVELRREGGSRTYGPGEHFFIPAGQPHGATVHAGYRALICFNAPDRYTPRR